MIALFSEGGEFDYGVFVSDSKAYIFIGGSENRFLPMDSVPNPIIQAVCFDSELILLLDYYGYIWKLNRENCRSIVLNEYTQLHKKPMFTDMLFTSITSKYAIGVDSSLWEIRYNKISQVKSITNVKDVALGNDFVIITCNDSSIWVKGRNHKGQLGLGDRNDRGNFTKNNLSLKNPKISCGFEHSLFLCTEIRCVYACGSNILGQLGQSLNITVSCVLTKIECLKHINFISAQRNKSICINIYGDFYLFGDSNFLPKRLELPPVQFISNGYHVGLIVQDINGKKWEIFNTEVTEKKFENEINCNTPDTNCKSVFQLVKKNREEYVSILL